MMGPEVTKVLDPCCQAHDRSYCANPRPTKEKADNDFYTCMILKCDLAAASANHAGRTDFPAAHCQRMATFMYRAVYWAGGSAYRSCNPEAAAVDPLLMPRTSAVEVAAVATRSVH